MTKEKIEARLQAIRQDMEQTKANYNAQMGAIQDCEYWLEQLEAEKRNEALPVSGISENASSSGR